MSDPSPDADRRPVPPPGSIRVGSIGGVDVLVRTSWFLVALLIAWALGPQIEMVEPGLGGWKYVAGVAYAVLLYLTVLLHEMSHALMARHYGLPVRWITLHLLGGMTEMEGEPETPKQEFLIAVVGPLTSLLVGGVALALWQVTPAGLLEMAVVGLAFANLLVGALNLVPGLPLDGGRVLRAAVWRTSGNPHTGTVVSAWGGRVAAVLALCYPFVLRALGRSPEVVDYLLAVVIAMFLWTGASMALAGARIRRRLPALKARPLARRAVVVPGDMSVAEAVRRAQDAQAGAIVVHAPDDAVTGLVNEAALLATPEERRPWQPISAVARTMEPGLVLPADISGEELVKAITRTPAAEYLLVEEDGTIYGVLATADVDHAFSNGAR